MRYLRPIRASQTQCFGPPWRSELSCSGLGSTERSAVERGPTSYQSILRVQQRSIKNIKKKILSSTQNEVDIFAVFDIAIDNVYLILKLHCHSQGLDQSVVRSQRLNLGINQKDRIMMSKAMMTPQSVFGIFMWFIIDRCTSEAVKPYQSLIISGSDFVPIDKLNGITSVIR